MGTLNVDEISQKRLIFRGFLLGFPGQGSTNGGIMTVALEAFCLM